jgi:hypothetical protein
LKFKKELFGFSWKCAFIANEGLFQRLIRILVRICPKTYIIFISNNGVTVETKLQRFSNLWLLNHPAQKGCCLASLPLSLSVTLLPHEVSFEVCTVCTSSHFDILPSEIKGIVSQMCYNLIGYGPRLLFSRMLLKNWSDN